MKVLAIDGNSILNRAFYGIKLLTTKDGRYTNAIYGFFNIFLKLLGEIEPEAVAVAFDMRAKTFRHELFDGYKAGRKGMPEELAGQLPVLKELLETLGYTILEKEGYEADDILGTIAELSQKSGEECFIVTGDRDSLQLVSDHVKVYLATTKMGRPQTEIYDCERIQQEYHTGPKGMIEIKALMGDSSDNIPGVAGIGVKTASDLIAKYQNLDYIYENIESLPISAGVKNKLIRDRDMAFLSRRLGTIQCDVPMKHDMGAFRKKQGNPSRAAAIFADLEMFGMIEKFSLDVTGEATARSEEEPQPTQKVQFTEQFNILPAIEQGRIYLLPVDGERILLQTASSVCMVNHWTEQLKPVLENEKVEKVIFDSKAVFFHCERCGIDLKSVVSDVLLSAYLLNPSNTNYNISNLLLEYAVPQIEVDNCPEELLEEVKNAAALAQLDDKLEALIVENGQDPLLHKIELPLAKVLAQMEYIGMEVDPEGIENFGYKLEGRIGDITERIYAFAGEPFNLNSPKQLAQILFERLGLPVRKKTKTGYSTNAEVLESLIDEHPIIELILEYRQLAKLKSTYCDALLKVVGKDHRIHSTFNQTETRTGRISSLEPNLQNIPIRQETGREMRRFFRAKEGCVLVDADYSQVELRVLAHMAKDRVMIEAFNKGDDIHTITASQVFNVPVEAVTPFMRSSAKAVNFGIVYGIGAFSLAKDIGVTRAQADQYIKSYLDKYAGVADYMERVVAEAKEHGYVTTLFGRRRYLPELTSSNKNLRSFGERVARNMPIQGTAADIIKIAMIRVSERLRTEGLRSRLIMQVHDELIVEAYQEEAEQVASLLKQEMEQACEMDVKLTVDVHTGKTWYDTKD